MMVRRRSRATRAAAAPLAEDLVRRAEAAGATEAEALVIAATSSLTRFANSEIHQNVSEHRASSSTSASPAGAASASPPPVERTTEGCRPSSSVRLRSRPTWRSWRTGQGCPDADVSTEPLALAWSDATADASPELRADGRTPSSPRLTNQASRRSARSPRRGGIAVANSSGIRAAERRTTSQLLTVSMCPDDGTGYAEQCAIDATEHRRRRIGREAAERARASANTGRHRAGDYPVVLAPLRRRGPPGHARVPRLLGPRGRGGPLVLGARPPRRLADS